MFPNNQKNIPSKKLKSFLTVIEIIGIIEVIPKISKQELIIIRNIKK